MEGGNYKPTAKPLDLRREIETIADTVGVLAQEQGLDINVIVAANVPQSVVGDPKAFRAIATNLVTNAVKFTEYGRVDIRLATDSPQAERTVAVVLSVEDTGRGIPEHRLESIFPSRSSKSTAASIAVTGAAAWDYRSCAVTATASAALSTSPASRGKARCLRCDYRFKRGTGEPISETVAADSAPLVPRQPAAARVLPVPASHENGSAGTRVLVVDDFELNREVMVHQLRRHGLEVFEATDGDEAITLARQEEIDLILMDIQMPGKDGITAIREIRQFEKCQGIPIIGFTASADEPTHHQVIASGANQVLTKPIGEAELITSVQVMLTETALCP